MSLDTDQNKVCVCIWLAIDINIVLLLFVKRLNSCKKSNVSDFFLHNLSKTPPCSQPSLRPNALDPYLFQWKSLKAETFFSAVRYLFNAGPLSSLINHGPHLVCKSECTTIYTLTWTTILPRYSCVFIIFSVGKSIFDDRLLNVEFTSQVSYNATCTEE